MNRRPPMNGGIEVPLIRPPQQVGIDVQHVPTPNAHPVHVAIPDGRGGVKVIIFGGLTAHQQLAAMILSPIMADRDIDGLDVEDAFKAANLILSFTPPAPPAAAAAESPAPPAT